jgi:hypothetical protein
MREASGLEGPDTEDTGRKRALNAAVSLLWLFCGLSSIWAYHTDVTLLAAA